MANEPFNIEDATLLVRSYHFYDFFLYIFIFTALDTHNIIQETQRSNVSLAKTKILFETSTIQTHKNYYYNNSNGYFFFGFGLMGLFSIEIVKLLNLFITKISQILNFKNHNFWTFHIFSLSAGCYSARNQSALWLKFLFYFCIFFFIINKYCLLIHIIVERETINKSPMSAHTQKKKF